MKFHTSQLLLIFGQLSASHHPYLSITTHCIDKEWNLRSFTLETTPMFTDHTGVNIYEALTDILEN